MLCCYWEGVSIGGLPADGVEHDFGTFFGRRVTRDNCWIRVALAPVRVGSEYHARLSRDHHGDQLVEPKACPQERGTCSSLECVYTLPVPQD